MTTKAVVLLSGGLDSATLLYRTAHQKNDQVIAVSFDYGQRHERELTAARGLVADLVDEGYDVTHHIVALNVVDSSDDYADGLLPLSTVLGGSALTDPNMAVPEGHYAAESMKATVVPNRNAIMTSIAYGIAVAQHADVVLLAVHAGDHAIYPDCRPEFIGALEHALRLGNQWSHDGWAPMVVAPFVRYTKQQIAVVAFEQGVPIAFTWSCYQGGTTQCGRCGTCVERREAIEGAIAELDSTWSDPTTYLDRDYWRSVVQANEEPAV